MFFFKKVRSEVLYEVAYKSCFCIEYMKKSKMRADEPSVIDDIFSRNSSVNVDKQVVEKRLNP